MNSNIGIDTLRLGVKKYAFRDDFRGSIVPVNRRFSSQDTRPAPVLGTCDGLLREVACDPLSLVFGRRAFFNHEYFSLNIEYSFKLKQSFCSLTMHLPKYFRKNNLIPASRDEVARAISITNEILNQEVGFECDLPDADVIRLDVARNVAAEASFQHYIPVFRSIHINRLKRMFEYDSSVNFSNSRLELMIYDKVRQLLEKMNDLTVTLDNLIRFELKFKRREAVLKYVHIEKAFQLEENFDRIEQAYLDFMRSKVFYVNNPVDQCNEMDLKGVLNFYRNRCERDYFQVHTSDIGINKLIQEYGLEYVLNVLGSLEKENGLKDQSIKKKLYRFRKDIDASKVRYSSLGENSVPYLERYFELRNKVLAA